MRRMLLPTLLLASTLAHAQVPKEFNACAIFTADDAAKAIGAPAEQEAVKGKPPKVITSCSYNATFEGKPQLANVQFRFARTPAEAAASFRESRLEVRGKPVIINGSDAYWHPKLGQLHLVKGATWLVITVGSFKENERQPEQARKLAELMLPKL